MKVKHQKESAKADPADSSLVGASDWNADHALDDPVTALSIASGVVTVNCALGDHFTLALTANVTTLAFSNLPDSGQVAIKTIRITQDTTARTLAFPSSFKWPGGTAGVVSSGSGAVDRLIIVSEDPATYWDAVLGKAFA